MQQYPEVDDLLTKALKINQGVRMALVSRELEGLRSVALGFGG